jgi:adenine-specific DNA methylase
MMETRRRRRKAAGQVIVSERMELVALRKRERELADLLSEAVTKMMRSVLDRDDVPIGEMAAAIEASGQAITVLRQAQQQP